MNGPRSWDVYQSETLVIRKALNSARIREDLASGVLNGQDLIRPAGTDQTWKRIAELPLEAFSDDTDADLLNPDAEIDVDSDSDLDFRDEPAIPAAPPEQAPVSRADQPSIELQALRWLTEEDEPPAKPAKVPPPAAQPPAAKPVAPRPTRERPQEVAARQPILEPSIELHLEPATATPELSFEDHEDEEDDFTLSRSKVEHVEEMDLAAMVDIAFQLVLFFMVTASVTMIKSMELPKPTESTKPAAASAPGVGTRDRNELATEFIVVKISTDGEILVDDEPIRSDQLIESLRAVRNESGKTGMLLRAENRTKHRLAVAAYDAANEIGLRIAIERDTDTP